jgi:hypothetical protein
VLTTPADPFTATGEPKSYGILWPIGPSFLLQPGQQRSELALGALLYGTGEGGNKEEVGGI